MAEESGSGAATRRHRRVPARVAVRLSTIEPERDPWTGRPFFRAFQDTCVNLSRGGAFVRTSEPLSPGRRLLVELELPGHLPLEAIGRVAWTKRVLERRGTRGEAGIGIEFLGGASEHFAALEDFIDQELRAEEEPAGQDDEGSASA